MGKTRSRKTLWTEDDVPAQAGRVFIVTGASSGLGWETARVLTRKGATVILACRNRQKAEEAAARMQAFAPAGRAVVMDLDLADLDSVHSFAAAVKKNFNGLDVLINNAGVGSVPYARTAQGFELHFGVNHLGHFALTGLLIDILVTTPDSRVVTVSSLMHRLGVVDFDDLNSERGYATNRVYSISKLENLLFTYELQRRLAAAGRHTIAVAAHPGWSHTPMTSGAIYEGFNRIFAQQAARGALPALYAATAPDVSGGDYIGPSGFLGMSGSPKKVRSGKRSHDQNTARRLWEVSEKLTGVDFHL